MSLLPLFNGKPLPPRKIFIEHEGNRFVRDGDWKLVSLNTKPKTAWELYNLATDPTETKDLAAQEPERVKALAATFQEWWARVNKKTTQDKNQNGGKGEKGAGKSDVTPDE